jgi:hypothetical protein
MNTGNQQDFIELFEDIANGVTQDLPDLANETLGERHVTLKVPFNFKDFSYHWAPLRIPTGRDWRAWFELPEQDRTPHAWLVQILAAPVEILDVMHAVDYVACINAASELLNRDGLEK